MLMPGLDGLDVAASLHERTPEVPVVIASSVGRREIESDPRWETAGIGAFMTKPIKASPLQAALASVLGTTLADRDEGADERDRSGTGRASTRSGSCWPRTTP